MESCCDGKCIAQYVCDTDIPLYSRRCMQTMRAFDLKGLNGGGDKLKESEDRKFRDWIKVKREIDPMYAHGMDLDVLEEIWLFAQVNTGGRCNCLVSDNIEQSTGLRSINIHNKCPVHSKLIE